MSSNTTIGNIASQTASTDALAVRRKAVDKCQLILETLHDSLNGYKQCSLDTKDNAMKLLFNSIASSRTHLIVQLADVIHADFGVHPVTSGSALASAHRTWIDVKCWFTDGRDKSVIISEIHRGEHVLITFYQSAIEDPTITAKVRDLLHEQLKTIQEQCTSVDFL